MKRSLKWVLGIAFAATLLLFVGLLALTFSAFQREPLVAVKAPSQLDGADSVNTLLAQLQRAFSKREEGHEVTLSEQQIESLVGVLQRAIPNFSGEVNVTPVGSTIALTFSPSSQSLFINVSALIVPGNALALEQINVGDIHLSGRYVLSFLEWAINTWTESEVATLALTRIEHVSMTHTDMTLRLGPLDALLAELNNVKLNLGVDEESELSVLSAYYLRYISGRELALSTSPQSLIEYLREGMARAREQSETEDDAVLHNKAVIVALAAYVGHHSVGHLVGDIQPNASIAIKPKRGATLHGRNDLARHFIISAAFQLLSEEGVSLAIGEFKELMDRGLGGSGYSFVDLAADMAGAEFAKVATDPARAKQIQTDIARIQTESQIIPPILDLPEGLSKDAFTLKYERVDSEQYVKEVEKIRQRLGETPMYSPANKP